jgi:hypothetical protein
LAKEIPIAVLDACVLIPMPLTDTLLRLAEPPALYRPRWTDIILGEVSRTLIGRFGHSQEKVSYRESAMRAFPNALVADFERHIPEMRNHPKDRHVLAAAVRCEADCLVTLNLRDFPMAAAQEYKLKIVGPSKFLKWLWAINRSLLQERLREQAGDIGVSLDLLLDRLAGCVPAFVSPIRNP